MAQVKNKTIKKEAMIHILPVNDLREHDEETTCPCKPSVEILDDGEIMITHNSFDGREIIEKTLPYFNRDANK